MNKKEATHTKSTSHLNTSSDQKELSHLPKAEIRFAALRMFLCERWILCTPSSDQDIFKYIKLYIVFLQQVASAGASKSDSLLLLHS
jgi:hypothetical protein